MSPEIQTANDLRMFETMQPGPTSIQIEALLGQFLLPGFFLESNPQTNGAIDCIVPDHSCKIHRSIVVILYIYKIKIGKLFILFNIYYDAGFSRHMKGELRMSDSDNDKRKSHIIFRLLHKPIPNDPALRVNLERTLSDRLLKRTSLRPVTEESDHPVRSSG
jgi:hypothetical protein